MNYFQLRRSAMDASPRYSQGFYGSRYTHFKVGVKRLFAPWRRRVNFTKY